MELSREFGIDFNPKHHIVQQQADHFINTKRITHDMGVDSIASAIRKYSQDLFLEKQVPLSTILHYEGALLSACAEKCNHDTDALNVRVIEGRTWFNQYEAALVYCTNNQDVALMPGSYTEVAHQPENFSSYSESTVSHASTKTNHDYSTVDYQSAHTYIQPDDPQYNRS